MRRAPALLVLLVVAGACPAERSGAPRADAGAEAVPAASVEAAVGIDVAVEVPPPPHGLAVLPLERVAVIGASLSAGFGALPVDEALRAALPASEVAGFADTFLFQNPAERGGAQVDRALGFRPATVVALDYLFWPAYQSVGAWPRELDRAFEQLQRLVDAGAVVVIGDVPRMATASPSLIPPGALPSAEALDGINRRIRAWAAERPRVVVVPLTEWIAPLTADGRVVLPDGESYLARGLLSFDGLHPNRLGVWYVLERVDRLLEREFPGMPAAALVFRRP
jgi:hypothetical protein